MVPELGNDIDHVAHWRRVAVSESNIVRLGQWKARKSSASNVACALLNASACCFEIASTP